MSAESISTKVNDFGTSPFLRRSQAFGHVVATTFVVLVLLSAAGLKIHSSLASSADGHRFIPLVIALGEILLGILLLCKWTRKLSWIAAGFVFASFALFNSYQSFVGRSSCGCFGEFSMAPTTALIVDLGALALLTNFPPAQGSVFSVSRVRCTGSMVLCGVAVCVGAIQVTNESGTKEVAPGVREGQNILVLTPSEWVGHPLPIAAHLDCSDLIDEGDWELWLVDPGCKDCQSVIHKLDDSIFMFPDRRIALVIVARYPDFSRKSSEELAMSDYLSVTSTLLRFKTVKRIECQVPICVICRDARVIAVREAKAMQTLGFTSQTEFSEREIPASFFDVTSSSRQGALQ